MPNYLNGIADYSTKELVNELAKREGVERMTVSPHTGYQVVIDEDWDGKREDTIGEGSAVILVVTD